MFLYILNCLYLVLWAILLVHCLRTKKLYPIFGNGWGTKIFWLFTFVFFNPLLSLLYIFCILCSNSRFSELAADGSAPVKENNNSNSHNPAKKSKAKTAIPIFAFAYTCIVLILFEVPRTGLEKQAFVILNKTGTSSANMKRALLKTGMNIGLLDAKNKIQTVSSNSASDGMKVNLRNIMITCKSDNDFIERIALGMQTTLLELPYVNSVSYYSYGHQPGPNDLSDVSIILDMPELTEDMFLLDRQMQVKIACSASSTVSEAPSDSAEITEGESIVPFKIKTELQHTSRSFCIECPGTERRLEAKNISNVLTNAISKQFDNLLNKYAELPKSPEILYGKSRKQSEVFFVGDKSE